MSVRLRIKENPGHVGQASSRRPALNPRVCRRIRVEEGRERKRSRVGQVGQSFGIYVPCRSVLPRPILALWCEYRTNNCEEMCIPFPREDGLPIPEGSDCQKKPGNEKWPHRQLRSLPIWGESETVRQPPQNGAPVDPFCWLSHGTAMNVYLMACDLLLLTDGP